MMRELGMVGIGIGIGLELDWNGGMEGEGEGRMWIGLEVWEVDWRYGK